MHKVLASGPIELLPCAHSPLVELTESFARPQTQLFYFSNEIELAPDFRVDAYSLYCTNVALNSTSCLPMNGGDNVLFSDEMYWVRVSLFEVMPVEWGRGICIIRGLELGH